MYYFADGYIEFRESLIYHSNKNIWKKYLTANNQCFWCTLLIMIFIILLNKLIRKNFDTASWIQSMCITQKQTFKCIIIKKSI